MSLVDRAVSAMTGRVAGCVCVLSDRGLKVQGRGQVEHREIGG